MLARWWRWRIGWHGAYLVHDIFQRIRAVDGEAYEEEIGLGVRKWSQSVIFFLSGSVPEGELDCLASRTVGDLSDVVLKHGWYVFLQTFVSSMPLFPW